MWCKLCFMCHKLSDPAPRGLLAVVALCRGITSDTPNVVNIVYIGA